MKQPNVSEPPKGDYLLARAKRELERLLRAEGYSRKDALTEVHRQFLQRKTPNGTD